MKYDDKLTEEDGVYIQAAILFTSCSGQRRLRVVNLALNTGSSMAEMYRNCEYSFESLSILQILSIFILLKSGLGSVVIYLLQNIQIVNYLMMEKLNSVILNKIVQNFSNKSSIGKTNEKT